MTISVQLQEEQKTLPHLRVFRGEEEAADMLAASLAGESEPDPDDDPDPDPGARCLNIDDYWAGRNRAMRRSARSAA